jgi:hypothetical protein
MEETNMEIVEKKLKIIEDLWLQLEDQDRWETIINQKEAFNMFVVMLDNDDTYLRIKEPINEYQEEYFLSFDGFIGNKDGVGSLLDAIGIEWKDV